MGGDKKKEFRLVKIIHLAIAQLFTLEGAKIYTLVSVVQRAVIKGALRLQCLFRQTLRHSQISMET